MCIPLGTLLESGCCTWRRSWSRPSWIRASRPLACKFSLRRYCAELAEHIITVRQQTLLSENTRAPYSNKTNSRQHRHKSWLRFACRTCLESTQDSGTILVSSWGRSPLVSGSRNKVPTVTCPPFGSHHMPPRVRLPARPIFRAAFPDKKTWFFRYRPAFWIAPLDMLDLKTNLPTYAWEAKYGYS